ncbi:dipeptide/tripeptide permease [Hymenobacter chitinivorans DSM 11115]|uniref:Dipeptide/tripeptide permease n=2 Tax=Hymenobacter chitinivorans TaxID=89969 RepID=A0A2M9BRQ1_9BACT|nr:dipeptide/tripeptide permease [Hymenobacter chitinivorans DSM 11115]
MRSMLGMQFLAPLNISRTESITLVNSFLSLSNLLLVPGAWLADRLWGLRRTLLMGAALVLLAYLLLAVFAVFPQVLHLLGLSPEVAVSILLVLMGVGSSLLMPGLFVALGKLSTHAARTMGHFLLVRFVGALTGMVFPMLGGTLFNSYGLGSIAVLLCAAAGALLVVLRYWRQETQPTQTPVVGAGQVSFALQGAFLALFLLLGAALLYLQQTTMLLPVLGLVVFVVALGYLNWRNSRSAAPLAKPSYYLPGLIAGAFLLSTLSEVALGAGYGADTPAQVAVVSVASIVAVVGLFFWVRRRDSAVAERQFLLGSLYVVGLGICMVAGPVLRQVGPLFTGNPTTVLGFPPALLLQVGVGSLLFLLPVSVSQHAPVAYKTRFMALALLISSAAYNLADLIVGKWLH